MKPIAKIIRYRAARYPSEVPRARSSRAFWSPDELSGRLAPSRFDSLRATSDLASERAGDSGSPSTVAFAPPYRAESIGRLLHTLNPASHEGSGAGRWIG